MSPQKNASTLSRDRFVERALAIVDEQGLAALTIRRIADDLGVTPMAIYWHFANKDALLAGVGIAIVETIDVPEEGAGLEDFLTRGLTAIADALRAHPNASELVAAQLLHTERGLDLTERALRSLVDAGFTVADASMIAHHAMLTVLSLVTTKPGDETAVAPKDRADAMAQKAATLRALPPERYPLLVEAGPAMVDCPDDDAYYALGIGTFVAGVLAQVPR